MHMNWRAALLVVGWSMWSGSAHATAEGNECAVVRRTNDGFVALRERATANSRLLEKLQGGQLVEVVVAPPAAWLRVYSVVEIRNRRLEILRQVDGWVSADYVQTFGCN